MNNLKLYVTIFILLFLKSACIRAESGYIGGSAGINTLNLNRTTFYLKDSNVDNMTYQGYFGISVLPLVFMEGTYTHFGTLNFMDKQTGAMLKKHNMGLGMAVRLPIPVISPYAKVAANHWTIDDSGNYLSNLSQEAENYYYGAGVNITLIPMLVDFGLEYNRFILYENKSFDFILGTLKIRL